MGVVSHSIVPNTTIKRIHGVSPDKQSTASLPREIHYRGRTITMANSPSMSKKKSQLSPNSPIKNSMINLCSPGAASFRSIQKTSQAAIKKAVEAGKSMD